MKKTLFIIFICIMPVIVFSGEVNYKIGPLLHEKIAPSQTEQKTMLFQQQDPSEPSVEGESEDFIKIIVVMDRHHLSDLPQSIIDELETRVTELGGCIGDHAFNRVQVFMPVGKIKELAEWEEIKLIKLPTPPGKMGGSVRSEGLNIGNINNWHENGFTGNGVRVGVLDSGFNGYANLIGSDLPQNTIAVYTGSISDFNQTEHGTACAEIIHDVAPSAALYLVNAGDMDVDYVSAVNWLKQQNVDIISSSMGLNLLILCRIIHGLLNSPYYSLNYWISQSEHISRLEDQINYTVSQTVSSGVTWSQAANNNGRQRWKGVFNDTDYDGAHNFSNGSNYNELVLPSYFQYGEDVYVVMVWGGDTDGITYDDYDLKIVNEYGYTVVSSMKDQYEIPLGMEACKLTPIPGRKYYTKIERYRGTIQEIMLLVGVDDFAGLKEYSPEKTVNMGTPCANPDVITVGAVPYDNPYIIEDFSGQGPGENGIIKPDLVAPDRVSTVSYGWPFYGTSAAAPHVAGVSTLVKQRYPSYSPQQIKSYLESNATDLGVPGKDNVYGSGLVQLPDTQTAPNIESSGVSDFVSRFYQVVLGRDAETAGLNYWIDSLENRTLAGADVAREFIFSNEFVNKGLGNEAYVDVLYSAFFNREPDQDGRSHWLGRLYGGTSREDVLNGFIYSQEFVDLCEQYSIAPFN
jgi:subtilisin family serine protease